jgi:NADPH:quinone reductase-like Zn-dependent oxidoreductase
MNAAVVANPAHPPQWSAFDDPVAAPGETIVTMSAAALSPLARATAAGTHYSAAGSVRSVAGVDGVGTLADGRRVYCAFPRSPWGTMAQRVPIRSELWTPVPDALDDVRAAALGNPGMASWVALLDRARLAPGETVLINGATGSAGRLAIQIAKHLGASRVIATGRNPGEFPALRALGADRTIDLMLPGDQLVDAFYHAIYDDGVTVVLDFLWGDSAERLLKAIARPGNGPVAPRIRFVQIGAVSGPSLSLDAATLRSSGVELLGSGLRSVALSQLVGRIGEMLRAAKSANFTVDTVTRPIERVETAWNENTAGSRLVFTVS